MRSVVEELEYYRKLSDLGKAKPIKTDWKPDPEDTRRLVKIHNKGSDGIHGVTYDLAGRDSMAEVAKPAFAVSVFDSRERKVDGWRLKVRDIKDYVRENSDLLKRDNVALGTWYNRDDGKTYLDCAVIVGGSRLQEVVRAMAKGLGVVNRQLAVFNLKAMDELKVPKNLQSDKAMAIDRSKQALNVLPITGIDAWAKKPGRYDIRGIDTPPKVGVKRYRMKRKAPKRRKKLLTMTPTLKSIRR